MSTKLATALANEKDAFKTGQTAAQKALLKLSGKKPGLCLIFTSIGYDLGQVLKGVRSVVGPEVQVIGGTSCGEFTEEGVGKKGLSLGLISSDEYRFQVKAATGLKEDVQGVFQKLKKDFDPFLSGPGVSSFIMIIDGLTGNGEEATLAALVAFQSDLRLVGGAAGDELAFKETKVIANDQILSNAVSLCAVKGPHAFVTGVKHGHKPLSGPLTVTQSKGSLLLTVNGRPAWDVWKDETRVKAKELGIDVDKLLDASSVGAHLLRFELGLETSAGEYKIRIPLSKNDDGSLNFACTIPEGAVFHIMQSVKEDQVDSARATAKQAKLALDGRKAVGALVFDCVCRSLILGPDFKDAVTAIKQEVGNIPVLGFETYGEICMDTKSFSGFHNTTSVVALIAE
jgi:hypothetical protein